MDFLNKSHLDLTAVRIETPRCVLVPFSLDGIVDIEEITDEFCRANKELYVSPFLPTYDEEIVYLQGQIDLMRQGEILPLYILEKGTSRLLGATGLNDPTDDTMSVGLWIREDEQGKGYATEVYTALLAWAREHIGCEYLMHYLHPANEPSRRLALKFGGVLQDEVVGRYEEVYRIYLH